MSLSLNSLIAVWSFFFGSVIASFLNVVIWRVPRGESIVRPPSHCPRCGARIKWYQNIPIFSWLALGGKCADCRGKISPRYIAIETLGGFLFMFAWLRFGLDAPFIWVWIALMIVGSAIDFDHKLLPDFVTVGGMIYGLFLSLAIPLVFGQAPWTSLLWSVVGALSGLGVMWLIRTLGTLAFKREAMGMGDVLLMGAVGSVSGWDGVLFALIVSSFLGSIGGVVAMLISRKCARHFEIPYGPYICLANLIHIFFGQEIVAWYLGILK